MEAGVPTTCGRRRRIAPVPILCMLLPWIGQVNGFLPGSTVSMMPKYRFLTSPSATTSSASALPEGLPRLGELLEQIKGLEDEQARRIHLVALGDRFAERPDYNETLAVSSWPRVPGCVSVVHMRAGLSPDGSQVEVGGSADSRVARGLVALVSEGLTGARPEAVLALDPLDVARGSGIRATLTPGRQNGLVNMIKTVQASVQEAVQTREKKVSSLPHPEPTVPLITSFTEDVAVLLSGGVDSSVALNLLQQQGLKVRAFYLKIWLEDEVAYLGECPWEDDWAFAQAVCQQANVPLEAVPLQKEYWDRVVSHTIAEARAGRTPNPDIMCNSMVKFGVFYDHVGRHFHTVATGHYARAQREDGKPVRLFRSPDRVKDQTYFLSRLKQDQLARAEFPIGRYTKPQIRELASSLDLPTKARKDSQGICFLGKLKFDDFLRHYLGENPGDVVWDDNGLVVGQHRGLWFHTIGQRKGIVPTLGNAYRPLGPWYVTGKDIANNVLHISNRVLAEGEDEGKCDFVVEDFSWISGAPPAGLSDPDRFEVQIRHGPTTEACMVKDLDGGSTLVFSVGRSQKLAAGQYAAIYEGDECLGAGVISEKTWEDSRY